MDLYRVISPHWSREERSVVKERDRIVQYCVLARPVTRSHTHTYIYTGGIYTHTGQYFMRASLASTPVTNDLDQPVLCATFDPTIGFIIRFYYPLAAPYHHMITVARIHTLRRQVKATQYWYFIVVYGGSQNVARKMVLNRKDVCAILDIHTYTRTCR